MDTNNNTTPSLLRADCAFGNEMVLSGAEKRNLNYLFKVRKTQGVKKLIDFVSYSDQNELTDVGQGWSAIGGELKLEGWTKKRKVLIQRRTLQKRKPGRPKKDRQLSLPIGAFVGLTKSD